jgi:hypothetical protein
MSIPRHFVPSTALFTTGGGLHQHLFPTCPSLSYSSCIISYTLQKHACLVQTHWVTTSRCKTHVVEEKWDSYVHNTQLSMKTGKNRFSSGWMWKTSLADDRGYDRRCVCQVGTVSQKICANTVPCIFLLLFHIKELPRKQSFGHTQWQLSTNYWKQISRNELATANGSRTSPTICWKYLISHGLQTKPGLWIRPGCLVTQIHKTP